jgi:hypothetical protein
MARGKKTGGGSRKGSPNRATANAREAIAAFVDGNAANLQKWLEEVYTTDGPKAALACYNDLVEYHVPKLARTEISSPDGSALSLTIQLSK